MALGSRQLAELVERAAAARAARSAAVAEAMVEPAPPPPRRAAAADRSAGERKAPLAGTLRLSSGGGCAAVGRQGAGQQTLAESSTLASSAERPLPHPIPSEGAKHALSADERRERRDRRLARHGLSMADVTAVTWRLMGRWPAVFGEHRRALAVGIHHGILAEMPDCNRQALSIALRQWCSHPAYLRALATGRHRHSLAGEDVADISPGDRAWAHQQLQELRQQRSARQPSVSGGLR